MYAVVSDSFNEVIQRCFKDKKIEQYQNMWCGGRSTDLGLMVFQEVPGS